MSDDHRKVRLSDLRRPDITIVVLDAAGAEVEYTIRGQLELEEMAEVLEIEKITEAMSGDDPSAAIGGVIRTRSFLDRLVEERYPDAPKLRLSMEETMVAFAALLNGRRAAEVMAEALSAGMDPDIVEQTVAEQGGEEEVAALESGDTNPTTPSEMPSSTPSGISPSGTDGPQTNGGTSAGDPSASTSSVSIGA